MAKFIFDKNHTTHPVFIVNDDHHSYLPTVPVLEGDPKIHLTGKALEFYNSVGFTKSKKYVLIDNETYAPVISGFNDAILKESISIEFKALTSSIKAANVSMEDDYDITDHNRAAWYQKSRFWTTHVMDEYGGNPALYSVFVFPALTVKFLIKKPDLCKEIFGRIDPDATVEKITEDFYQVYWDAAYGFMFVPCKEFSFIK